MKLNSITTKLLLLIAVAFIVTAVAVIVVAKRQTTKIIDANLNATYSEKVDSVWWMLKYYNDQLRQSGMVDTCREDIQREVIAEIKHTFYKKNNPQLFPFIIDNNGKIIVYPQSQSADNITLDSNVITRILAKDHNQFVAAGHGSDKWYCSRSFSPWHWTIGYTVPLAVKYKDTKQLHFTLLTVTGVIFVAVLVLLSLLLARIIKPIGRLTTISSKIADGDFEQEIEIKGNDEVSRLSRSFVRMQEAIEDKIQALNKEIHEREKIEKQTRLLATVAEQAVEGIAVADLDGRLTFVNQAWLEMHGFESSAEVIGQNLTIFHTEEQLKNDVIPFNEKVNVDGLYRGEVSHVRRDDGSTFMTEMNVIQLKDDNNEAISLVAFAQDITERKLMEERLRQSEKMDAVGQLAGGIAHDFNNMLGGIMGAAELLKLPDNSEEMAAQYIKIILNSANRAADLTAKLSAFGRKGKITSKAVDINIVISDTLAILKRTVDKKIKLIEVQEATDSIVIGDQTGLQNALLNLCINACHAMPDGGDLSIISRNLNLDQDYCNASPFKIRPGEYVDLEVIDTGTGIPQNKIQHIFEPFFTTKELGKGTGLGLAAVYGMVKDHNGAINVYSEVGTGTSFHLFLPCTDDAGSLNRHISENKLPHGSGCVLLVDDEKIIRVTGKSLLEKIGYKVITAENGRRGVEVFKQCHDEIDLVIMDMIMPEMNGSEAFYAMKKIDPDCSVFISSGFTKNEKLEDLEKNGLCGFIHKPFSINELNKLICQTLGNRNC